MKRDERGMTELHWAAYFGEIETAKCLIDNGADLEVRDRRRSWTPLFYAVSKGNLEMVKFLVDSGADVDVKDDVHRGCLNIARRKNHREVGDYIKSKSKEKIIWHSLEHCPF